MVIFTTSKTGGLIRGDMPVKNDSNQAISHSEWGNGHIDFSPWPYPSATRLLIENLQQTVMGNRDTAFIQQLDPDFVVRDLVDYHFVKVAMQKYAHPDLTNRSFEDSLHREEVVII